jgi:3-dehydroquinate synthase
VAESAPVTTLTIQSHRGPYVVEFEREPFAQLGREQLSSCHFIVDRRITELYSRELAPVLSSRSVLQLEASERSKTLDQFTSYVEHLIARGVRRNHKLVAIGGGIIQDVTAFIASTLLRGLNWEFFPTTLLAQADSCIGSKSSINVGHAKNMMGTFRPPTRVYISMTVLSTLAEHDIRSGIGEMLKVHAISGPEDFDRIARDYPLLLKDSGCMEHYIHRSLDLKKVLIELDEFDTGARNVMNYGHSFGHAIEAATHFGVPHGIAVTIGMDMANYVATRLERMSEDQFQRMHGVLKANARGYLDTVIPLEDFYVAIGKDKKNVESRLTLILPNSAAKIEKVVVDGDERFRSACRDYVDHVRRS